ncbi:MAG: Rv2175c family DNA-binding protein [Cellulomonas sp.]|uniref:Transcriptional regulator n=1 Tax=Cellulomonas gelida TaxID=1712 RepID=A0A4Y3KN79_9CELL|nr:MULTISPECIES: Rv2175c family DNA-binding protein [Cellulomonas]KMM46971.1 transcriptional regulator [Cellulomonas sp. A375-1]MCR6647669.1 Rv2175c family DNA-binding protein [Cellulomonas sp.]MCR6703661.1 Rv2175c family DNA-binding protein [Cellulomonas sp.]GEA85502.1 transcriptional regulator [Cellulomonas gelida]GGL27037.1 transcriptional regulator [Cellulomonas gelida]
MSETSEPTTAAVDTLVDSWLTLPDVAERVGLDVGKVRRLLQERKLVGVRRGEPRVLSVPERFLVPGHQDAAATGEWAALPWLQGTLTVLADAGFSDEEAIVWLFTPDESLPGTPIDALRAGQKTEIRRRAQAEL